MKRVNEYRFIWPCCICNTKVSIRQHYRHFRCNHPEINLTTNCYMCLKPFASQSALFRHHRFCVDRISHMKTLRLGHLVLLGSNLPIKRPKYRPNRSSTENFLNIFEILPTIDDNQLTPPKQIELKIFKDIKPVMWNEDRLQSCVQWLTNNESSVHDDKVRQIAIYLSLKDQNWYHIIISRYHFELFVELATTVIKTTPYKCICDAGNTDADDRILHAHLLVSIKNIQEFKRVCWNKLPSPDGQKFKKLVRVKGRFHLYNCIFYMSQTVKCTETSSGKHHDMGVSLTDAHANLVLLLYRDLFYNHVLESQRTKISLSRFDIYTLKDERGKELFASITEEVVHNSGFSSKVILSGFTLVSVPNCTHETLTVTADGFLNLIPQPGNVVTMTDVLKLADGIHYCWTFWYYNKARHIKDMLFIEMQPRYCLALHCDEENFGIFGDYWKGSFRMPEEEAHARSFLEKAIMFSKAEVIVINNEQRHLMKTHYGIKAKIQTITTPVNYDGFIDNAHLTAMLLYRSVRFKM